MEACVEMCVSEVVKRPVLSSHACAESCDTCILYNDLYNSEWVGRVRAESFWGWGN
jgi:hypothetical protein